MSLNSGDLPTDNEALLETIRSLSSDLKLAFDLIKDLQIRNYMQEREIDLLKGISIDMEHRLKFLESGGKYPVIPVDNDKLQ